MNYPLTPQRLGLCSVLTGMLILAFMTILPCLTLLLTTQSTFATQEPVRSPSDSESSRGAVDQAVAAYADLTSKTVLRSSQLPSVPDFDALSLPKEHAAAVARIESLLSTNRVKVIQDGPHFVRIFSADDTDLATNPPVRGEALSKVAAREIIPAGTINFPSTDVEQVLQIYAELRNRTILRPAQLPATTVQFKTVCALNKKEAEYALTTVLALNGIWAVDDGVYFVQLVPRWRLDSVRAKSPARDPGVPLLDRKNIPAVGFLITYPKAEAAPGRLLANLAESRKHCADRLLAFYAELQGKEAVPSPELGDTLIKFGAQSSLNREEALYAIRTTLSLNGLTIVEANANKLTLGKLSQR